MTNCTHCQKPVTSEDETVHVASGSFICHFSPDELPAGQSYCDCWSCEDEWLELDELFTRGEQLSDEQLRRWTQLGGTR
jgi:hypothetical protein